MLTSIQKLSGSRIMLTSTLALSDWLATPMVTVHRSASFVEKRLTQLRRAALWTFLATLGLPAAIAFVTPATGSFGYDIYDVVVNDILNGPIGFVGGVALIVWGATMVMKQWMVTMLCVIAGTVIIKAQTLLTSLGAIAG